jgi:TolB-like protein
VTARDPHRPAEPAIREQLERILASAQFTGAESARKLLRFLVEETLAGAANRLKEYTLATDVFGRDASFDPRTNPAVRVEASRLRRRLEYYYLTLGRDDPVLIELPRGTYVPAFLPHADVLHLREDLARARAGHGPNGTTASLVAPPSAGPSIVVLPFENLGGADPAFCDGITVEIVTALSRFRELRVTGRGTAFRHRGERDAVKLHDELGVQYVLAGSVRRAEKRLRVNAELMSGEGGGVVWAEGYERDLGVSAIFDVQDEITSRVVTAIAQPRGVIARPGLAAARHKPPGTLGAYDSLLLFYDYAANRSPESHRTLREALVAQTRKDPRSAALWAALSLVRTDTWRFGYNVEDSREAARDEGFAAARQAVELDPLDPLGYHALFLAHFARGDMKGFREAGNRALELNPNHTDILADYGFHLTLCDEWDTGMLLLKVALALNPEPPEWFWFPFFMLHFDKGEYDAALDMALRSPGATFFWTHGMHAMAYAALGMKDEAAAAVARLLAIYPEFPRMAREELSRWLTPKRCEKVLETLRRSGVPIPPDETCAGDATGGPRGVVGRSVAAGATGAGAERGDGQRAKRGGARDASGGNGRGRVSEKSGAGNGRKAPRRGLH